MLALGFAACTANPAVAGDPQRASRKPAVACPDDERRAGYPHSIAHWAKPFPGGHYRGYYVGGGAALFDSPPDHIHGENRRRDEGTFGVDYAPWYSTVRLHWFHGRNHQGGEGQYESDEKNNPFSVHKRKLVRVQQHKSH
ncbi:MAG: hypothetical protein ACKO2P_06745 [Planctomycetota bacterium]